MKNLNLTIPAALGAIIASPVLADAGSYNGNYEGFMMGGHGFFGGFSMLLFWAVTIGVIVLVVRWLGDTGKGSAKSSDALETLRGRLARGEIDPEEFEARKKALES